MPIDIVPVDYLSQAIVHLSTQGTSAGQTYNFANPHAIDWTQLVDWLNDYGYSLEKIPYTDWLPLIKAQVTPACDNALAPYLSFLTERSLEYPMTIPEIYFRTHRLQFENENLLAEMSCSFPSVVSLLPLYFSYFTDSGYLNSPQIKNRSIRT